MSMQIRLDYTNLFVLLLFYNPPTSFSETVHKIIKQFQKGIYIYINKNMSRELHCALDKVAYSLDNKESR